jgi:CubicO group peptidase (beta-lactamase class C family)
MTTESNPDRGNLCLKRLRNADDLIERYVAAGILPGAVTLVARHGEIVHFKTHGYLDIEKRLPMREDALFRIYSMTKMITSVAIFLLYEKGSLDLNDPILKYLPAFANRQVKLADGSLVPADRDVTIYDLLRHCGGLSYSVGFEDSIRAGDTLETVADKTSTEPLIAQPGTKWIYGVSTDILARIVEVISGEPFDQFLQQHIFLPLGRSDTAFYVPDEKADRFGPSYLYDADKQLVPQDTSGPESLFRSKPSFFSGGGGLISTTRDYYRFATMLLNYGRLGDLHLLGRKTVELMTLDHLPKDHLNLSIGTQCFRFGLGVSIVTDVAESRCLSSLGDFGWGGALGTQVWMNPEEKMVTMIMIQVRSTVPTGIMDIYKRLVYQALVS